ncbi:MAG: gamma-glutamyl-gamma-aminobutyrate hydrolase family protein [Chloroflexi bacterium]|nr:gamma-glutamyl-gamma-aminobutyrate hydrolase family protein [Chloroflexota bacterium]MDA1004009.1 gamma-glutamyl-gamma-aminobutyrate hydrolase family protein [Chloroflexota bacterium]
MAAMPNPAARPRILISRAEDVLGERWDDYADCVRAAGGDAAAIDLADCPDDATARALPPFAGLLVTAGVDVDPSRYGEARSEYVREIEPARDDFEQRVLEEARRRGVPVFAICRGVQILNVTRGGSLIQHLEQREPHRARRGPDGESIASGWHEVAVAPGSLLAQITGASTLRVNSRHHQAIPGDGVGSALRASGVAPDGVVEAVEDPEQPWLLGVQWHPERPEMAGDPACATASMRLFEAFVAACRDGAEHVRA